MKSPFVLFIRTGFHSIKCTKKKLFTCMLHVAKQSSLWNLVIGFKVFSVRFMSQQCSNFCLIEQFYDARNSLIKRWRKRCILFEPFQYFLDFGWTCGVKLLIENNIRSLETIPIFSNFIVFYHINTKLFGTNTGEFSPINLLKEKRIRWNILKSDTLNPKKWTCSTPLMATKLLLCIKGGQRWLVQNTVIETSLLQRLCQSSLLMHWYANMLSNACVLPIIELEH